MADIGQELARQPEYEAALGAAQAELARLEKEAGEVEVVLSHLRQEKEALENQQWQLGRLREQITAGQADLGRWQEQLSQHQARIRDYERLLGQRAAIEDGFARFSRARQRADELDRNFRRWAALAERRHHLEMKVQQLGQELVTAHAVAQRRIQEMEAIVQKLPRLRAELGQVQAGLPRLAQTEEGLRQKRQRAQALEVSRHSLGSDQARLEAVLGEIEERLKLLATEGGVKCPLCDTELGPQGRQRLEAKYAAERQARTDELAAARSGRERQEQELAALKAEVAGLEAGLVEARTALQSRTGQMGQAIKEAEEAGQPLEEARLELADIERRLAGREFAAAEQQALSQLDEELAALDYDAGRHEQARQSLAELARYEAPQRRLEEADRLIGQEREAATRAEAAAGELRRRLELDREQEQALAAEMGRLPPLLERLAGVEAAYRGLAGPREQARQAVARAGSNLEHCAELAARQREKQGLIAAAAREEGLYRDLAQAFGKKGVQAWLIEMALPEIEEEANRLLARMTENRMHVKMETQRETKKGDLVETLDINIADELGTRDYEMFSGGEAFRINFAIRIAMSRLLARRAGAPLPTLIVDEGFGTQDSTGIERLKEAINSIQDNFEKIIVITHIDELKDAFPTRIEVVKTAAGSTLEVSG
ncbi:MAG: SMC family ATPase [Chloroflexota bacterium]